MKRYRIAIYFDAPSPEEAHEYHQAFARACANVLPDKSRASVMLGDGARHQMVLDCLKWGLVLGVAIAGFALYCIAEGLWTR